MFLRFIYNRFQEKTYCVSTIANRLNTIENNWIIEDDILYFRGTSNLRDLRYNANILLKKPEFSNGRVHKGFLSKYNDLRSHLPEKPPRIISGHSMGAALAILYTLDKGNDEFPEKVVLFACPNIGTSEFCNEYDLHYGQRTLSWTNKKDLVTRLPPRIFRYNKIKSYKFKGKRRLIGAHTLNEYTKYLNNSKLS